MMHTRAKPLSHTTCKKKKRDGCRNELEKNEEKFKIYISHKKENGLTSI